MTPLACVGNSRYFEALRYSAKVCIMMKGPVAQHFRPAGFIVKQCSGRAAGFGANVCCAGLWWVKWLVKCLMVGCRVGLTAFCACVDGFRLSLVGLEAASDLGLC